MAIGPSNIAQSDVERITRAHHEKFIWAKFCTIILGLWLISSPETFGYDSRVLSWSDVISGILLIFFAGLSLSYRYRHWQWACCFVGLWLQFAPLLFWAPQAVIYLNDTLIGILVIALCVLIPLRPHSFNTGPEIPPGWTYNPSSWHQRIPIIFFAMIGWFVARYLDSYQLGFIDSVWDPFFGDGTKLVITSKISQQFPIPDAGLGAFAYSLEAIMGAKGGSRRWHTMPWIVVIFGILVVPLGFVSILLVISQPVFVGAFCGLCLIIALCMLFMLALTVDEVVAVLQYLKRSCAEGKPFWKTFWLGSNYTETGIDPRNPGFHTAATKVMRAMVWGITIPWNLVITAILGIWMMFSSKFMHTSGLTAHSTDVIGPLLTTISIICFAEVVRAGRFLNIILGLWLAISPWFLADSNLANNLNGLIVGVIVIVLSCFRGKIKEHYGDWDKAIF